MTWVLEMMYSVAISLPHFFQQFHLEVFALTLLTLRYALLEGGQALPPVQTWHVLTSRVEEKDYRSGLSRLLPSTPATLIRHAETSVCSYCQPSEIGRAHV